MKWGAARASWEASVRFLNQGGGHGGGTQSARDRLEESEAEESLRTEAS